jgi:predicted O-linked N-acetylglucosamine transferase (SPINDLY family)
MNDAASAVESFRRACQLQPGFFESLYTLGAALSHLGRFDDALPCFEEAARLNPTSPFSHAGLGACLLRVGRNSDAIASLRRALELDPGAWHARFSLGDAYFAMRRFPEAIAAYEEVVRIKPDYAEAHNNLGLACLKTNAVGRALGCYRRAAKLNGNLAEAHHNVANVLSFAAQHDEALEYFRAALAIRPDFEHAHSNMLLMLNYFIDDPQRLYQEHIGWAELHTANTPRRKPLTSDRDPVRVLRVGYVSSDFYTHPVSSFFEPLLAAHHGAAVETFCYSDVAWPDETTERLRSLAHRWHDISALGNDAVADLVESDRIDILVDLAGHTGGKRLKLFARKPAPIQISYLGYPNTTGLKEMDYRFTDEWADPPGEPDRYHAEKLWRLNGGFLCYAPPQTAPAPAAASPSSANGFVTFGSFNHPSKTSAEVVATWSRLLHAVPRSRLLLKGKFLHDPYMAQRIHDLFRAHGVDSDRLILRSTRSVTAAAHLAMYGEIDVALDTFPYNGTTTTCEALWMGVPVVTLAGKVHAGRVGMSLLHVIGMEQWIAHSTEEYIELAASLAADAPQCAARDITLRSRMTASGLCDRARLALEIERAYLEMWQQFVTRNGNITENR